MRSSLKSTLFAASAAVALAFAGPALAAAPGANTTAPGVVNVSIGGTNGNVTVNTQTQYVNDTLNLQSTGAFSVDQSDRFVSVGQYTGDGNDIDRQAAFNGVGSVTATSSYQSLTPYSVGAATLGASVSATAGGGVQQNLTFDQNEGGAFTQDQWTKQRDIMVSGAGTYTIDVSDVGASIAPSLGSFPSGSLPAYSLDVNASAASGGASLTFAPTLATTGYQALANQADHSHYTGVNVNGELDFTGAPVANVTGHTVTGGTVTVNDIPNAVQVYGTVN